MRGKYPSGCTISSYYSSATKQHETDLGYCEPKRAQGGFVY
nr:MAG TPA: hypothetical protein [Caudoviricetes sp.]